MSTSFIYPFTTPVKAGSYKADPMSAHHVEIVRKMLCKPVSYASIQDLVCSRHFLEKHCTIAMRFLCLATDLQVIYNWLPWRYTRYLKKDAHIRHLQETYTCIGDSSCAQSFLLFMNDTAIGQADVHHASQDDISLYYNALPGDYRLQLLLDPEKEMHGDLALYLLQTCQEFFFSFQEVDRIVICLEEGNYLIGKMEKAGFGFEARVITPHKTAMLYSCARTAVRS